VLTPVTRVDSTPNILIVPPKAGTLKACVPLLLAATKKYRPGVNRKLIVNVLGPVVDVSTSPASNILLFGSPFKLS